MGTMKALLTQGAGLNIHFEGEQCYGSALLTHHAVGALAETSYFHYARYNPFIGAAISSANSKISCSKGLHHSPPWRGQGGFNNYHLLQQTGPKRWQCRLHDSSSSDDEYRSSRNIAISLFKRYRNFVERGGGDNLKDFITAGVNAYALGCTDKGLRKELIDMKQSGVEVEAMHGGNTSLKLKISSNEIDECIFWLSIIFITILCTPQPTIVRWSPTPSVSDEILLRWKGFCALIANAYFVRGMAWLPVKTLQLEQMAVVGRSEEPSVVASRMRLVFTTLEVVSPQWPRA